MKTQTEKKRTCIATGTTDKISCKNSSKTTLLNSAKCFASKTINKLKNFNININFDFPQVNLPDFALLSKKICVITKKNRHILKNAIKDSITRNAIAACGTLSAIIIFFIIFSVYFAPCYEFAVEGATIGYAEDKAAFSIALNDVNSELTENFGKNAAISKTPDTTLTIVKRSNLTSTHDFKNNVASLSALMFNAHVLVVDGQELVGFTSQQELDTAVDNFIASVSQENSKITMLSSIDTVEKYISASKMTTLEHSADYLGGENGIKVQTITDVTYTEPIPFTTKEIPDDTLYTNEKKVQTAGVEGSKTIHAVVSAVNGLETSREITSDNITSEPVEEVIRIGTRPIPDGIGDGNFLFPSSGTITSRFGFRWNRQHKGIDIANKIGTAIKAADDGVVSYSGTMNGYGNVIIINHKNGYETYYAHCNELYAEKGKTVGKGDVIAAIGNTGNSTGPHLHFEIRHNSQPVNPEDYVNN